MPLDRRDRPLSCIMLAVSLVLVTVSFGIPARYTPAEYYALAGILLTVICSSAWRVGARAILAEPESRKRLAVAGGLLIMPFALFSFLAGAGPSSEGQTTAEQRRWLVLVVSSIAVAGGWVVLTVALSAAGERLYSTLGFAAAMLAGPLYIIFTAIQLTDERAIQRARPEQASPGFSSLDELSVILLFFGGTLTYLAAAAFAASLGRTSGSGGGQVARS